MADKQKYNPDIHNRQSIRLKNYDYSQTGAYFVTICVQNHECLFGKISDGNMILNDAGKMIQNVWDDIPHHYGVEIDAFQIMPNHIHGIILINNDVMSDTGNSNMFITDVVSSTGGIIVGADPRVCPNIDTNIKSSEIGIPLSVFPNAVENIGQQNNINGKNGQPHHKNGQPQGVAPTATKTLSLSDVVHRFKTITKKKYTDGIKQNGWKSFNGKLWQRNFYEHIIRNEKSLYNVREYIINNPVNWDTDEEHFFQSICL